MLDRLTNSQLIQTFRPERDRLFVIANALLATVCDLVINFHLLMVNHRRHVAAHLLLTATATTRLTVAALWLLLLVAFCDALTAMI